MAVQANVTRVFSNGLIGCSGSSSGPAPGGGGGAATTSVSVPVGQLVPTQHIDADTKTVFQFTPDLDNTAGPFSGVTINLASTITTIQVSENFNLMDFIFETALATHLPDGEAQVTAFVATEAEIEVVCTEGEQYGPFTISLGTANELLAVDPPTATATESTVNVINSGSMSICLEVESNVAADLDVDQLDFEIEDCNESPADIAGIWTGEFSCTNTPCGDDPLAAVNLTITQNGDRATYIDDSGASFSGTVCGDNFNFNGGIFIDAGPPEQGFDESGRFVLTGANSATKTSKWIALDDSCMGTCNDTLTRMQ